MNNYKIEEQNGSIGKETIISFIKTAINLKVPIIGSLINEILFDLNARISQNRINEFVKQLGIRFQELENKTPDYSFFTSERYYDITLKAFESATKANSIEKKIRLSKVYIDAIFNKNFDFDRYSIYLDFVNRMSDYHVTIFKFVKEYQIELIEIESYYNYFEIFKNATSLINFDRFEFKYFNNELENWSLIYTGSGLANFDSTASVRVLQSHKGASVIITTFGEKFLKYILE